METPSNETGRNRPSQQPATSPSRLKRMTQAETFIWDVSQARYPGMPAWAGKEAPETEVLLREDAEGSEREFADEATAIITIKFPDASTAEGRSYLHPAGYHYQVWQTPGSNGGILGQRVAATTVW